MKKIIIMALAAVFCFSAVSCNKEEGGKPSKKDMPTFSYAELVYQISSKDDTSLPASDGAFTALDFNVSFLCDGAKQESTLTKDHASYKAIINEAPVDEHGKSVKANFTVTSKVDGTPSDFPIDFRVTLYARIYDKNNKLTFDDKVFFKNYKLTEAKAWPSLINDIEKGRSNVEADIEIGLVQNAISKKWTYAFGWTLK